MCTARHSPERLPEPEALTPEERAAALREAAAYFERVLPEPWEVEAAFERAGVADPFTG